jgi:hypothetical protein
MLHGAVENTVLSDPTRKQRRMDGALGFERGAVDRASAGSGFVFPGDIAGYDLDDV